MNYKLLVQYDGTKYNGWQKQGSTTNTIQGKLEHILTKMTGSEIEIHGSGRTDAGVHAYGQVANFKCKQTYDSKYILDYLNEYLPQDICVCAASIASERFHSRLNAIGKKYLYRIQNSSIKNVFERNYITQIEDPLDLSLMRLGASYLLGEHDFKAFCSKPKMKKSTIRTIHQLDITKENDEIQILIRGNGFLYHMVRIIAGTLVEVGHGKLSPGAVKEILESGDRRAANYMAPAKGLSLLEVYYD